MPDLSSPETKDQAELESKYESVAPPPSTLINLPLGKVFELMPESSAKAKVMVTSAVAWVTSTDVGEIAFKVMNAI